MRQLALIVCALLFHLQFLFSQDTLALYYSRQINPPEIKSYLHVLASDSLEGRETGKPGQKKAARFISKHFQSLKLTPPVHGNYLQQTSLSTKANIEKNFEVNRKFYLFMKDYFYPAGQGDTTFTLDSIVFAGFGINSEKYNDYENVMVKNKAVIFYEGVPKNKKALPGLNNDWRKILAEASSQKAALVLIITDSLEKIIEEFNYSAIQIPQNRIPFAFINREMARAFFPEINEERLEKSKNQIDRKGKPQSFISSSWATLNFVNDIEKLKGQNVLGYLEGTDRKDEVLVISAHYDHLGIRDSLIYYGADDNGSGTSAVMQIAKAFAEARRQGRGPRRSILFLSVSGEEKGLLGSSYYVNHPVYPLSNTVADLNIDMIGRTDSAHDTCHVRDYIYIIGSDKLSTELHRINEKANAAYTKLELDYQYNSPEDKNKYYYRSDHYNFAKNNIPIIFYFNGAHADYHKPTDTIDKIDFELLAKRAQLVFFTAWELANREERIKVDVKNDFKNK
jgi:hypothetical protein